MRTLSMEGQQSLKTATESGKQEDRQAGRQALGAAAGPHSQGNIQEATVKSKCGKWETIK